MGHGEPATSEQSEPQTLGVVDTPKAEEEVHPTEPLSETPSAKESNQETTQALSPVNSQPNVGSPRSPSLLPRSIPLPANLGNRLIRPTQTQLVISPPILTNPKCSGYFVEPVSPIICRARTILLIRLAQLKWMEPFLAKGEHAGKIICPNKKCNAKLGNYDWAGVHCSCNEWIVPVRVSVCV